jgi:hypothetical protein
MVGRIVITCNCITFRIANCLPAVCPIVFGVKEKDASSLFAFNSAAVCGIREAPGNSRVLNSVQIKSHHRTVLQTGVS